MSKLAYFDCPTGIAGDMCLGALLDAGVPLPYLQSQLSKLGIDDEFQLDCEPVQRNGQRATQAHVKLTSQTERQHHHPHGHAHEQLDHKHDHIHHQEPEATQQKPRHHHHPPARHLPEIERMILAAALPERVTTWSLAIVRELAIAEGAVHGVPPEQVHFHEVGATDAIVDIVGTCLGLDWLGIDAVYCSALPTGGGSVWAAHGRLPVPVPAVLQLWQRHHVPVYSNGTEKELVTPTGAAIAVTLAKQFGPPPTMQLQQIGLGAGSHALPLPNLLRLWIGQQDEPAPVSDQDVITILETQLDDLSPQAIGYAFEQLFAAGALDVFTQAIGMKKSRPGILLTVLCPAEAAAACEQVLFLETTTLGIRRSQQQRTILSRMWQTVTTPYGDVRIKAGIWQNQIVNLQPEFEDCAQLARKHQQAWQTIHQAALIAWSQLQAQT
jgi:uncharacterized protein (TIGR00299 family) protein